MSSEVDEHFYPRAAYWDPFVARTQAIAIHFRDEPTLSGFTLPDGTHLDQRDAPQFTRNLASVLAREGFLDPERGRSP